MAMKGRCGSSCSPALMMRSASSTASSSSVSSSAQRRHTRLTISTSRGSVNL